MPKFDEASSPIYEIFLRKNRTKHIVCEFRKKNRTKINKNRTKQNISYYLRSAGFAIKNNYFDVARDC